MKLWSLWILWAVTHRLYRSSPYSQKISCTLDFYLWSFKSLCEAKMHTWFLLLAFSEKKKIQLNGSYFCLQEWADSNGRLDERAKRLVLHGDHNSHLPLTGSHPQPFNHSCYQRGTKSLVCNQPRAHLFAEGITDCSPVLHPIWSFRLKCHK